MIIEEIIGKKVTNIYSFVDSESGGLDRGECFIELDNKIIIDIPNAFNDYVMIKELDKKAKSLFTDLTDIPFYSVNKEGKSIAEISENYKKRKKFFFNKLLKLLFDYEISIKEYKPYKVEYIENKVKNIKDKKIVDFIWHPDDFDKGFILLENGYLFSETICAPHGTDLTGLNIFESIEDLAKLKGNEHSKYTVKKGSH